MSPSDDLQFWQWSDSCPSWSCPMDSHSVRIWTMHYLLEWTWYSPNQSRRPSSMLLVHIAKLSWHQVAHNTAVKWNSLLSLQNSRHFKLFCNIYRVIIFHPHDKIINTVISGILVLISWWGAPNNRVSWLADCTMSKPPAVGINKWEWRVITCIIHSETGSLEGTARAID